MKHVRYQRRLIANMEKGDDDLGAFIKLSKKKRKIHPMACFGQNCDCDS